MRRPRAALTAAFRQGPLAVRDFRLLTLGQLTSTAGDYCYAVALPWLVLSTSGGTVLLGTVLACYGVPRTVLIPVGGVLADKIGPRRIMLVADAVRCVLVAALAVLAARQLTSLVYLGPVAALIGASSGMFMPSSAAIMPSLLPPEELQAGNGLSEAILQVGSLAGPVLGGLLVTTVGADLAFAVDAATFAVSAASLAMMGARQPAAASAATAAALVELEAASAALADPVQAADPVQTADAVQAAGVDDAGSPASDGGIWRLLRRSRELQIIIVVAVLANFVIGGTFEVALPALAHARFGAAGYGALIACFGVGALGGTLAAARLTNLARPAQTAGTVFLLGAVAAALVPFLGGLPGAAAADVIFGAAASFGNVVVITVVQKWAPPALLGRVMSLILLASMGAFPAAVVIAGVIVKSIGPAPFFPVAGTVFAGTVLFALSWRKFREFGAHGEPAIGGQAAVVAK